MRPLFHSSRRLRWIALPLGCLVVGAAVGAFLHPPSQDSSTVNVWALDPPQLERAQIPQFGIRPVGGVTFTANPDAGPGAAHIEATRAHEEIALSAARGAAVDYVQRLTARQDRWLRAALRGGDRLWPFGGLCDG